MSLTSLYDHVAVWRCCPQSGMQAFGRRVFPAVGLVLQRRFARANPRRLAQTTILLRNPLRPTAGSLRMRPNLSNWLMRGEEA
jgi:hypothetical protein